MERGALDWLFALVGYPKTRFRITGSDNETGLPGESLLGPGAEPLFWMGLPAIHSSEAWDRARCQEPVRIMHVETRIQYGASIG